MKDFFITCNGNLIKAIAIDSQLSIAKVRY